MKPRTWTIFKGWNTELFDHERYINLQDYLAIISKGRPKFWIEIMVREKSDKGEK